MTDRQIAITGSTKDILWVLFGPPQHDGHVQLWRWHLTMVDADRRAEAVAKLATDICRGPTVVR